MRYSVQPIATHENPNAVCAICRKNGKLSKASAVRTWEYWTRFFVCEPHAERAAWWDSLRLKGGR